MTTARTALCTRTLFALLLAIAVRGSCQPATVQPNCTPEGYRVVARRWDAVLGAAWELRQNCAHPEWPAHSIAVAAAGRLAPDGMPPRPFGTVPAFQPLQVHAGEIVRLWLQDATTRIEISGIAEQSGRDGDHVVVRITRQTDEDGMTLERIAGIVRGAGDVEMER